MICISPFAPIELSATGLKLDSTAITASTSSGSSPTSSRRAIRREDDQACFLVPRPESAATGTEIERPLLTVRARPGSAVATVLRQAHAAAIRAAAGAKASPGRKPMSSSMAATANT